MSTTAYQTEWNALPDAEKCRRVNAHVAAAMKRGTLGPIARFQTVCQGCGGWCSGYFHRIFDGRYVCRACAIAAFVANAGSDLQADGSQRKWEGAAA